MQGMLKCWNVGILSSSKVFEAETMHTEIAVTHTALQKNKIAKLQPLNENKLAGPHTTLGKREAAGPKGKDGCIVAILQINHAENSAHRTKTKPTQTKSNQTKPNFRKSAEEKSLEFGPFSKSTTRRILHIEPKTNQTKKCRRESI